MLPEWGRIYLWRTDSGQETDQRYLEIHAKYGFVDPDYLISG
jgi:hypothetical protein